MSYIQQNPQLLIFLIILAVLFVLVIVLAAVSIGRRNKAGLTLGNSTYGNNVEAGKDVVQDNSKSSNSGTGRPNSQAGTDSGSDRIQ